MKPFIYFIATAMAFASCTTSNSNMKDDQTAKNKESMTRFYTEVFNAHNPALIDSFCAANFTEHTPDPAYEPNREGLRKNFTDFFAGFPDVKITVNYIIAEGDKIMADVTITGTNTGTMMGMPPTGKSINVNGADIIQLKDGKATDHWGYFEQMKMMQQLGMMPDMNAPPADSSKMKM